MVRRLMRFGISVMLLFLFGFALFYTPTLATAYSLIQTVNTLTSPQFSGILTDTGQSLAVAVIDVQPADLDGDGDVDLLFDSSKHGGEVWLNGGGTLAFTTTGQFLGDYSSQALAVGDIDGDGDMDVVTGNDTLTLDGIKVWKNNGQATFTFTGQKIPATANSLGQIALGDLDGDSDLDLFMARLGEPNHVWLNNGSGTFTNSGQNLGTGYSTDVALGDLDGDGDLDAFVVDSTVNTVWFNNGAGQFTNSGQSLSAATGTGVTLGDIDYDGDVDAATSNQESNSRLWRNNGSGFFAELPLPDSGTNNQNVTFTDVDADGDPDLFVSRVDLNLLFFNMGGVQMGSAGTYLNSFQPLATSYTHATALFDFDGDHDPDAITAEGITSRVWRNEGLSSLGVFYGIRDEILAETKRGQHYIALYYSSTTEISERMGTNPILALSAFETLTLWKPNLETLLSDNWGDALITQAQVDALDDFLTDLSAVASPELQQVIAEERAALPPFDTFVGQTMSAATVSILGEPTFTQQSYLPLIYHNATVNTPQPLLPAVGGDPCDGCWVVHLFIDWYVRALNLPYTYPCGPS